MGCVAELRALKKVDGRKVDNAQVRTLGIKVTLIRRLTMVGKHELWTGPLPLCTVK